MGKFGKTDEQAKVKNSGKCRANYQFNFFLLFGRRLSERVVTVSEMLSIKYPYSLVIYLLIDLLIYFM